MPRPGGGGGDPLDARRQAQAAGVGGGSANVHRSSSAPIGGVGGGDRGAARHAASEGAASASASASALAHDREPEIPEHPVTVGRPTFRDGAVNAVAVVPLLGGGGGGGGNTNAGTGFGGGGGHSLESFGSLLDSLRHFAKSSASGDEPEMSHGMRMRAEGGGGGAGM